jgi:hypothetical protein
MRKILIPVAALLLLFSGSSYGAADRWDRIGEDAYLVYYLDDRSVISLQDDIYTFWLKLVDKKSLLKQRFHSRNLHHALFRYELDCRAAQAGARTALFFDRNNRQINIQLPADPEGRYFEPVVPESIMERVAEMICGGELDDSVDRGVTL